MRKVQSPRIVLLTSVFLAAMVGCGGDSASHNQAPRRHAPIVLRPHTLHFSVSISGGYRVRGAIYPAIPNYQVSHPHLNAVHLIVGGGHGKVTDGRIDMSSRMIGMKMVPDRGVASPVRKGFVGKLLVPMFGSYRITLALHQRGRAYLGHTTVTFSIPTH